MKLIRRPSKKLENKCLDVFGKIIEADKHNEVLTSELSNRYKAQIFLEKLFGDPPISEFGMHALHDTWKPKDAMLILSGITPYQLPQQFNPLENKLSENPPVEAIIKQYFDVYKLGWHNSLTSFNLGVKTLSGLSLADVGFYAEVLGRYQEKSIWRKNEDAMTLFMALIAHVNIEITLSFCHAILLSRVWDGTIHNAKLTPNYYFKWQINKNMNGGRSTEIKDYFLKNTVIETLGKQALREDVLKSWMEENGFTISDNLAKKYSRAEVWDILKSIDPKLFHSDARSGDKIASTPISFFKKQNLCKFVD